MVKLRVSFLVISDLTEVPDADGLLSEERVHIEQSKVSGEGTPELVNQSPSFTLFHFCEFYIA